MDLSFAARYRVLAYGIASIVLGYISISMIVNQNKSLKTKKSKSKKKSRNKQISADNITAPSSRDSTVYPRALVNLGNTCFANSILQSLEIIDPFREYLKQKKEQALLNSNKTSKNLDSDKQIILQLDNVLSEIACSTKKRSAFTPSKLIKSMGNKAAWISSASQQDAHEFFQMLMAACQTDFSEQDRFSSRLYLDSEKDSEKNSDSKIFLAPSVKLKSTSSNPFTGLVASKISCLSCAYTASLNHFSADCISIPVPNKKSATIEECLGLYTGIDTLDDFKCKRCRLHATACELEITIKSITEKNTEIFKKISHLESALKTEILGSKDGEQKKTDKYRLNLKSLKKRFASNDSFLREMKSQQTEVDFSLKYDIDAKLEGIELSKSSTGLSTKQTMFARLPRLLCLHLNRSMFLSSGYLAKNSAKITANPILDMAPFLTSGHLDTRPNVPISRTTSSPNTGNSAQNSKYRLAALVSHVGSHDSGHYYAYKRVACISTATPEKYNWFRISDSDFTIVDENTVMNVGNSFMLFYERINS